MTAPIDTPPRRARRALPALGGAAGLAGVAGLAWWLHGALSVKPARVNRTVQTVTLVRPPPPPPEDRPPPPPEEQPKEPVPMDSPEPQQADNEPAPSEQLGLDAEGTAGGDAFGLAARKGGRDIAGSGGAAFAWYTGRLKDNVSERLSGDPRLRAKRFSVTVKVWIQSDGRIQEVQLASTTGSPDLDKLIQGALASVGRLAEPPPIEMPQPVSLRIVSRI